MQGQKEFLIVGDHTFQVVDFVPFGYEILEHRQKHAKRLSPFVQTFSVSAFSGRQKH